MKSIEHLIESIILALRWLWSCSISASQSRSLWSSLSLDIVGQGVRFGKYQDWKVCPEQPLLGTLLL